MGGVVVLGGGSTSEAFVGALRRLDESVRITVAERELVGGECSYWACMPSKTLLRSPEVVASARIAPGAAEALNGPPAARRVFWWRDQVVGDWDDSSQERWLADRDVELVRGSARVAEPGIVTVGKRRIPYEKLVIATGSRPTAPPIHGLAGTPYWTSRDATSSHEVPASLAVLGGGAVGCELAQAYLRLGTKVTLVHRGDHLLPKDDPEAGETVQAVFEGEGMDVRLCAVTECVHAGEGFRLALEEGDPVEAERLLVATGRRPNTDGLGLDLVPVEITKGGVRVDERMRAGENVWAIGDVTGIALFTHVGKYQGRVAAHDVAGRAARADYRAIPAVTFTDPQVASVGRTSGEGLVNARRAIDATSRTSTYERPKRSGFLKLFADPERRVLVGATAVGPDAGEWLGQLTVAIRAEVPIDVLRDTIQPYPTFSEAVFFAARSLPLE